MLCVFKELFFDELKLWASEIVAEFGIRVGDSDQKSPVKVDDFEGFPHFDYVSRLYIQVQHFELTEVHQSSANIHNEFELLLRTHLLLTNRTVPINFCIIFYSSFHLNSNFLLLGKINRFIDNNIWFITQWQKLGKQNIIVLVVHIKRYLSLIFFIGFRGYMKFLAPELWAKIPIY